jgi:hypothetical protein
MIAFISGPSILQVVSIIRRYNHDLPGHEWNVLREFNICFEKRFRLRWISQPVSRTIIADSDSLGICNAAADAAGEKI